MPRRGTTFTHHRDGAGSPDLAQRHAATRWLSDRGDRCAARPVELRGVLRRAAARHRQAHNRSADPVTL